MKDTLFLESHGFSVIQRTEDDGHAWHYVKRRDGVAILPITEHGDIVLVTQKRPIIDQVLMEIPAGGIDDREDIVAAAHRELEEETGYRADSMQQLISAYATPGYYTEKFYLYLATGLKEGVIKRTTFELKNDLKVFTLSLEKALQFVQERKICDAKTIIALLFYAQMQKS